MKLLISLSLIIVNATMIFAQDLHYVNAKNGLIVRSKPNKNANKVTKLKYKTSVYITEKTGISLSIIDEGKKITGEWVKIKTIKNTVKGYVFDGFLIKKSKPVKAKPKLITKTETKENISINTSNYYVANIFGAKVYENPTFTSKTLETLPIGKSLVLDRSIDTKEKFNIGSDFSLNGRWIKPKDIEGYVFSSNLTNFKPISKNDTLISITRGKKIGNKVNKRIAKYEDKIRVIKDQVTEFENATYTYTEVNGCFDHVYLYKNMTLSEVYHQFTKDYSTNKKALVKAPKFIKKSNDTLHFEKEDASERIEIVINNDDTYTVSSFGCF